MPWGSGKRENEAGRLTARRCSGIPCLWQFMDSAALILPPSKWINNSCRGLTLRTTLQRQCFLWILYNFNFKLIRLSCRWVKNLQLHTDTVSCFHDCSHLPWDETCPIRHSHPARFKHISVWLPLSSFHSTVAHPQRAWKTASFLFLQLVIHAKTSSAKAAIYCLRWGR